MRFSNRLPNCPTRFYSLIVGFIFLQLGLLCSLSDGRKSRLRTIRQADEFLAPQHPQQHHIHVDLDYDKLLKSFGVPENISLTPNSSSGPQNGNAQPDWHGPENRHYKGLQNLQLEVCTELQCDRGQQCRISPETKLEECVCRDRCPTRHSPVCGSDGNWYDNHCQLHQTSCREKRIIHAINSHNKLCHHKKTDLSQDTWAPTQTTPLRALCTKSDYAGFKEKILLYFYESLVPLLRREESASKAVCSGRSCSARDHVKNGGPYTVDKRQLLRDMLDKLDENGDEVLNQHELQSSGSELNQISEKCHLDDILRNEDTNADDAVGLGELFVAYGLPTAELASSPSSPAHQTWTVNVGNSIEIPCSLANSATTSVTWERNHITLNGLETETGLRIGIGGSLYVTHAQLIHAGNYSCYDAHHSLDVLQTHSLRVLLVPQVEVQPRQHFYRLQDNATIKCHAVGFPYPSVEWLKNDQLLQQSRAKVSDNGSTLLISNLQYKDTGAYACRAKNLAGSVSDISSVFIVDRAREKDHYRKLFAVFHPKGVAFYEPVQCRPRFRIRSVDVIPGTSDYVCGKEGRPCEWGDTVNVMDRYIYASQPLLNRIVIISLEQMMVVQVITTDNVPVKLSYVPHLDQIWVLCWTTTADIPAKTIQVIRDASIKTVHTAIHPEPHDGKYETVADLFIPPVQELAHKFIHAYGVHSDGNKLYKIDMRTLNFIKVIDLTPYRCRPRKVTYSSSGGLVFLDCVDMVHGTPRGQIILDYLTDAVLHHEESINGIKFLGKSKTSRNKSSEPKRCVKRARHQKNSSWDPGTTAVKTSLTTAEPPDKRMSHSRRPRRSSRLPSAATEKIDTGGLTLISPDSRYWVNLGNDVIRVQEITEAGLIYLYDVVTTLHIADVTFHPSHLNHSYDLYASALTRDKMLSLELGSGRLSTISGIGFGTGRKFNLWGSSDMRSVSSSGIFGSFVLSEAKDAVFVVNSESRSVNCEINGLNVPQKTVWIEFPSPAV